MEDINNLEDKLFDILGIQEAGETITGIFVREGNLVGIVTEEYLDESTSTVKVSENESCSIVDTECISSEDLGDEYDALDFKLQDILDIFAIADEYEIAPIIDEAISKDLIFLEEAIDIFHIQ